MVEPVLNFINGTFVQAKSSRTLDDVNPATGETITTVARSKFEDVNEAAKAAMEAAPTWSQTTMEERIEWLNCIADALEAEAETIAQLESLDTGKPITLARNVDTKRSVANFRFLLPSHRSKPSRRSVTTVPSAMFTGRRLAVSDS